MKVFYRHNQSKLREDIINSFAGVIVSGALCMSGINLGTEFQENVSMTVTAGTLIVAHKRIRESQEDERTHQQQKNEV